MIETIIIMTATTAVFLIGINVGFRLRNNQKPIENPKTENIPLTKQHRVKKQENEETKKFLEEINRTAEYIESFGKEYK